MLISGSGGNSIKVWYQDESVIILDQLVNKIELDHQVDQGISCLIIRKDLVASSYNNPLILIRNEDFEFIDLITFRYYLEYLILKIFKSIQK